jgi:hypothetical protein
MVATATKETIMPLGPFPLPDFDTHPDPAREPSSFWTRVRTRWRRSRLDDELSAGTDPRTSVELSERASQLRSEPVRTRLANTLVDPLVGGPARELLTIGARPRRAALKRNLDELVPLIERLCDGHPIDVRGAAMTARLVSDTQGPLYRKGDLRHALRAARIALDARDAGGWQLRRAAYVDAEDDERGHRGDPVIRSPRSADWGRVATELHRTAHRPGLR